MDEEITSVKEAILSAVPVERLYLFGSYANGTQQSHSDYDFYIVVPNDSIRPIDAIGDAQLAMRGMKIKPVDILAGTVDIFSRRSKQMTIERKIAEEGVLIYERR